MLTQKLAIAREVLILLAYKVSSKTCNSFGTIDFTDVAKLPQKLVIATEALILLALRSLLKNLQ